MPNRILSSLEMTDNEKLRITSPALGRSDFPLLNLCTLSRLSVETGAGVKATGLPRHRGPAAVWRVKWRDGKDAAADKEGNS